MSRSTARTPLGRREFLAAAAASAAGWSVAGQAAAAGDDAPKPPRPPLLVRHEGEAPRERSTCGWRDRLISREDAGVAAWAHAVDIDGAKPHYHRVATEIYYVLSGEGTILLDGKEHAIRKGSLVHIPPGVVHGAKGRMRILVVGIPNLCDDDLFFPDEEPPARPE